MVRKLLRQEETNEDNFNQQVYGMPQVPKGKFVAGYIRQSTRNQALNNLESAEMQAEDVLRIAKRLGIFDEDYIILFTENIGADGKVKNASGRLRIDQRESLQALVERIKSGEVKAVICWREDRLFRDETLIQPLTLADICKQHGCLIATPYYTYDFNNNRFDLQLFMMKAVEAANFLKDYVKQQLQGARDRTGLRGEYDGRAVAFGYLFERKEDNPRLRKPRKPIVYTPNVEIVNKLFQRFYELKSFADFDREMRKLPYIFPEYPTDIQLKYIINTNARRVPGGYHILGRSLQELLTNPMYIGHWTYKQRVVQYNNHEPIVDESLFSWVFNFLSPTTLEGEPNENRGMQPRRYAQYNSVPHRALLEGKLSTLDGNIHVSTDGDKRGEAYRSYVPLSCRTGRETPLAIQADALDTVIVNRLFQLSKDPYFVNAVWKSFEKQKEKSTEFTSTVDDQIKTCLQQIAAHEATLKLSPDVLDDFTREETAKQLKGARITLRDLESTKVARSSKLEEEDILEYLEFADHIEELWGKKSLQKKQRLIRSLIVGATIQELTGHWLLFSVQWYGPYGGDDSAFLWRGKSSFRAWTVEENTIIRDYYPTAPRDTLLNLLPSRAWYSITQQAAQIPVQRTIRDEGTLPKNIALDDVDIIKELGITEPLTGKMYAKWLSCGNFGGEYPP